MDQQHPYTPPANGFRTFVILWATQALSVFGSQLTYFAMTVWLTTELYPLPEQKPALAAALSLVSLAFALPNVLIAPMAGVLTDRADRKTIMFWTDIASGLVSLALLASLALDVLELWSLVLLMTCSAVLQSFHNSSFDASYAMIVPENRLPRANGMMQTVFGLSGILAPALAASLIALPALFRGKGASGWPASMIAGIEHGATLAIAVNVLTFFTAAAVLPFLSIPSPRRTSEGRQTNFLGDVKEGMVFIAQRRGLIWLLVAFAVFNFCSAPVGVFRPMIVRDSLSVDAAAHGLNYEAALALMGSVGAIGGVVGGVVVSAWGGLKRRRVLGALVPLLVGAAGQVLFGLSSGLYVAVGATAVLMFTTPLANAHSQTIWQTQTPREMQGRVFAVRRVVAQFTSPLGTALSGLLGTWADPGVAVAICGLVSAAYVALQFFNRSLMSAEDSQPRGNALVRS